MSIICKYDANGEIKQAGGWESEHSFFFKYYIFGGAADNMCQQPRPLQLVTLNPSASVLELKEDQPLVRRQR